MEVISLNYSEFDNTFKEPYHIYSKGCFNFLNQEKVDEVFYLAFKDGHTYKLGIIGGIIDNSFYSPFSAPFGGFVLNRKNIKLQHIEQALDKLLAWLFRKGIHCISITLPPSIYERNFIAQQSNILFRKGFVITEMNINHSFNLNSLNCNYESNIWPCSRKNLRSSLRNQLIFNKCDTASDKAKAYEIIKINREYKNFPLKMTWCNIYNTLRIINADFFIVSTNWGQLIAAAIIFNVNETIAQIIYWGDIPSFSKLRPMNFLSFKIFEYYKEIGKQIVDIGPSSSNSNPNYGLCEFKESIGSEISTKLTYFLSN